MGERAYKLCWTDKQLSKKMKNQITKRNVSSYESDKVFVNCLEITLPLSYFKCLKIDKKWFKVKGHVHLRCLTKHYFLQGEKKSNRVDETKNLFGKFSWYFHSFCQQPEMLAIHLKHTCCFPSVVFPVTRGCHPLQCNYFANCLDSRLNLFDSSRLAGKTLVDWILG